MKNIFASSDSSISKKWRNGEISRLIQNEYQTLIVKILFSFELWFEKVESIIHDTNGRQ